LNRKCVFCKSTLINVYRNREEVNLKKLFQNSEREIKIMLTSLESIKDHIPVLKEKAKVGVRVEICTMSPTLVEKFFDFRDCGKGNRTTKVLAMKGALDYMMEENEAVNFLMDIRVYSKIPTMILFIIDDECIVNFLVADSLSRDFMHLHFNFQKESILLESGKSIFSANVFKSQFDNVFRKSKVEFELKTLRFLMETSHAVPQLSVQVKFIN